MRQKRLHLPTLVILLLFPLHGLPQQLTYYKHIRPLLLEKCVPCHHSNGYAPFGLERYIDVKKRSGFLAHVVANKIMPPWKANEHYREFANNRSLSTSQIEQILQWINEGCREGIPLQEENVQSSYTAGSQLPLKPDLVLSMKEPFVVPAINQNVYICYKIPFGLPHDTFIKAVEFIPGNKSIVHHVSYQIVEVADDVDINSGPDYFIFDEDTLNRVSDDHDYRYFNLIGKDGTLPAEVYHGGWLPGTSVQVYPSDIGFRMPRKGVLLIRNFHYSPTPVIQTDRSSFNFFYSKTRPSRNIGFAAFRPRNPMPDGKWYIRANDSSFKAHINVKFHNEVSLLNINPHMHRLGKYFLVYAVTSLGDTIKLVEIPQWDYNWQEFYRFRKMIRIPAGSVLHAEAVYDNSANNPENPSNPPTDMLFEFGMNDNSEMMRLVLLYLPYQEGDEEISLE